MTTLKMTVNTYSKKGRISPLLYGSFAEHLGRCIYDGIYLKNNPDVLNALSKMDPNIDISRVNIAGLFGNLLPVTIGNIIGGSIMVGLIYWIVIVFPQKRKEGK